MSSAVQQLRWTWLGMMLATAAVLSLPPTDAALGPWARIVWAPALGTMYVLSWLRDWNDPVLFPVLAAGQLIAAGIALDGVRLWRSRGRRAPQTADPLLAWKLVLVAVTVTTMASYVVQRRAEHAFMYSRPELQAELARERHGKIRHRLDAVSRKHRDTLLVVFVGDSRLMSALHAPRGVSRRLSALLPRAVQSVNLTVDSLEFPDLEPFVDDLVRLAPDLIVFDTNSVFLWPQRRVLRGHSARAARWANNALDRLDALLGREPRGGRFEQPIGVGQLTAAQDDQEQHFRELRWRDREASPGDPGYVLAGHMLSALRDAGIPTVLLDTPPSDRLRAVAPRFLAESRELCDLLAESTGALRWHAAGDLADSLFRDTTHLNLAGRTRVSAELYRRVAALLRRRAESAGS